MLLAVCNANYEFTLIDIGHSGIQSDSSVYNNSKLGCAIDKNQLEFPETAPITGYDQNKKFPYVFVADEAFALKPHMMRPFSRRNVTDIQEMIFNYKLPWAR